jgi:hypothetical protein
MKKLSYFLVLLVSSVVFTGCLGGSTPADTDQSAIDNNVPAADQKSGDTTKTGTISSAGGKYFLSEPGQPPREIESYSISLSEYVGKTVTVTGQYSGDTLFVGKIK